VKRSAMRAGLDPFSFLVVSIAGWMNQCQYSVIEYLIEEIENTKYLFRIIVTNEDFYRKCRGTWYGGI
jgi:hypothetical protein